MDIADILIRNGADMNLRDVNGFSSIHLSVHRGKPNRTAESNRSCSSKIENKSISENV